MATISNSKYFNTGLTSSQALTNLKKFGYNEIIHKTNFRLLKILLSQFTSFLIIILIIAGSVSIFLHETIDGLAIFGIVIINTIIGFIQEYKAENAVNALKKMVVPTAIVLRDGQQKEISIKNVVPGDIVILSEGEKIPADLEIIESFSLKVDESMLTGESLAVDKFISTEKEGKLFKGTIITTGRAKAKVLATGKHTEFGKIIELVSKEDKSRSPLSIQLDDLGKKLGLIILVMISILFGLGYIRGIDVFEMLMTAVALGVSAIPEGMPIIVTLTLALGVQVMAKKKAIVRKMNSIETLGATTIICSDKTGTLTLNEMTVKKIFTNLKETLIPGLGYEWTKKIKLTSPEEIKLMEICENCNNSFVDKTVLGDPTEIALKVMNRKAGFKKEYKEIDEKVFTSERKMMSSLVKVGTKKMIFSKGAYEEILKRCKFVMKNGQIKTLTPADRKLITKTAIDYSAQALRVLAMAFKEEKGKFDENDLVFAGIVGMLDPPRKTVKTSIATALAAGIKVRMITGDNAITAKAVGESIGLTVNNVMTGDEIDKLSNSQLKKAIYNTEIFARTNPQHKYRIVDILQRNHEVVAVTGDGVNDAPALKHADVGIAMGIKGTEATKEVADIILKDDNFTTIVTTIEEGRRIYRNILAFIKYMLSANFITIVIVAILTIFGFPLPMLALQILWLNIATDSFPALALGQSPTPKGIMQEKPHPKKENIFKKFFGFTMAALVLQVAANLIAYFYGLHQDVIAGINTADLSTASHARTMVFTQTVIFELLFAFVCKEEKSVTIKSITANKPLIWAVLLSFVLQLGMIYLPFMQKIFHTQPLELYEWLLIAFLASTAFIVPKLTNLTKIFSHPSPTPE